MVLVDRVVAVHRIVTQPVTELHEDPDLPGPSGPDDVLADDRHVLAGDLEVRRWLVVPAQDPVFLEVGVDGVRPAFARLEVPHLGGVLSRERADGLVEELAVHRPGAALPIE